MRISAKADYAVRASVELALSGDHALTAEAIADRQDIPLQFLQKILLELRRARLVSSQRGQGGGHRLARAPKDIAIADILRAVEGPLASVRGELPEEVSYNEAAESLQDVWIALRTNVRAVLESVTVADLAEHRLPKRITALTLKDGARSVR